MSSIAAAALVASVSASAEPRQTWSGFYVGLHGGYGWTPGRTHLDGTLWGEPTPWYTLLGTTEFPDRHGVKGGGFLGGMQAGFNYQFNTAIVGVEADISYSALNAHFRRSGSYVSGMPPSTKDYIFDQWHDLEWLATLRGRLGIAQSNTLHLFITGGAAAGGVKNAIKLEYTNVGGTDYAGSKSSTRIGWTAGLGAEFRHNNMLSTKIEYLYYDLGKSMVNGVDPMNALNPVQPRAHIRNNGHVVRLGVNYSPE
jgi:outer membrane immunogenic protein